MVKSTLPISVGFAVYTSGADRVSELIHIFVVRPFVSCQYLLLSFSNVRLTDFDMFLVRACSQVGPSPPSRLLGLVKGYNFIVSEAC